MPLPDSFRKSGADASETWEDLRKHDDVLDQRDWQIVRAAFRAITDSSVRLVASDAITTKMLDSMAGWVNVKHLSKEIWAPFSGKSALIAIDECEQPRDHLPFVELMEHLARTGCATERHTVSLTDPNWTKVKLNELSAACFIGRHTMFQKCAVLAVVPGDLRFHLPKDDPKKRGKPLDSGFHHIRQERKEAQPDYFLAEQGKDERIDYAVIQRFPVDFGVKQQFVLLLIQGATSLGTTGAGQWVASGRCGGIRFPAGLALGESSRLEILLEVRSKVHERRKPWEPECLPKKIFVDDAKFVVQQGNTLQVAIPRKKITVGTRPIGSCNVRYVLFDGDDVRVRSPRPNAAPSLDALSALCLKLLRIGRGSDGRWAVDIETLRKDNSVWPRGADFLKDVEPHQWFRDNLKEDLLGDVLTISWKRSRLEVSSEIEIVEEEAL